MNALNYPIPTAFSFYGYNDVINQMYAVFMSKIIGQSLHLDPYNMPFMIDIKTLSGGKIEEFWHLIGFDDSSRNKIKHHLYTPCINTQFDQSCNNCLSITPKFVQASRGKRYPCLLRASHINMITDLIDICNEISADSTIKSSITNSIKLWDEDHSKIPGELQIYLNYVRESINYLIVMSTKENRKVIRFVAAYPVFEKDMKIQYKEKYKTAKRIGRVKIGP